MDNRVALITGGSRGIGFGIAEKLAEAGFDLVIAGRRSKLEVSDVILRLIDKGIRIEYFSMDVGDRIEREGLIQYTREVMGKLNVLVNNAGIAPQVRADLLEASEDSFERVMRINLQGPYFLTQKAARWMVDQKKQDKSFQGCIVNISSVSSTVASPNRGEYCISKAGVSMATKLWAVRLSEYDIPVYEVRPGIIETDMTAGVKEKYDHLIAKGLLLQERWGQPPEIGRAVLALVEGNIPYATGQVLVLDGGLTLQRL